MVGSKELHSVNVGEVLKQLEMDYACNDIELRDGVVHIFGASTRNAPMLASRS